MTTSYKSPHGSPEPEQPLPEIKISRSVRPHVSSGGQQGEDEASRPVLSEHPAVRSVLAEPVIQDGHIILHRSRNFYVRTTNRHGQRPNPLRRRTGHTTLMPRLVPEQAKRVAASETRMMPNVAPINPLQTKIPVPAWLEAMFVVIGLLASMAAHGFNMFSYPQY